MARQQVQYDGRAEALQTVAAPKVSGVNARFDPRGNTGFALAEALGAAGPAIEQYKQVSDKRQEQEAMALAMSMPVSELNRQIKEGKLLASKSPVFVATVQHIAGQNTRDSIERDVLSKIERGELSFSDAASLDSYITEQRNAALDGQSQFTVAGFDKGWNQFRQKVLDANTRQNDKKVVEEGIRQGSDAMRNASVTVTSPDFQGTDADRAKYIMETYAPLRERMLLRDDAAKSTWDGLIIDLARTGNKSLVKELLDSKLPNNGPPVRFFLGDGSGSRAVQLQDIADKEYDQMIRKRDAEVKALADKAVTDQAINSASVYASVGRGAEIPAVTLPSGRTLSSEDIKTAAVQRITQADPNMSLPDQIMVYSRNGVKNPQWENQLKVAATNLSRVSLDAQGKPVGQIDQATMDYLNLFAVINQTAPQYAESLVGSEKYQTLSDIQFLREGPAGGDVARAVADINQVNVRRMDPQAWGRITTEVNDTVADIMNPGFFSRVGRWFGGGEFSAADKNLLPVANDVRRLTTILLASGQATTKEEAIEAVGKYYQNPAVTTQINNTIYLNKDLPTVPNGEQKELGYWMKKYMDDVIGKKMRANGITDFKPSDIVLMPNKGGSGVYQVNLRAQGVPNFDGVPGYYTVTRKEVENWIASEIRVRGNQDDEATNRDRLKRLNNSQGIGDIMAP